MDISHILDPLNDAQREAVTAPPGNVLVLGGPGTGKSRVLVHRMTWLLQVEKVQPWALLAVTFNYKAARELRGHLENTLSVQMGALWAGTFHHLAYKFLRAHWKDAGLPENFQILDSEDQLRLIRRIARAMELDESRFPPRQIQGYINKQKDEGLRPDNLEAGNDHYLHKMIAAYREYEGARNRGGLLDFADLLLCSHETLRARSDILHHYRNRFRAILVDSFQDTNAIQYAWLRLLAGSECKLFAVGDDDQSIYGWRGARVENIQSFQRDYPGTHVVRLEQNYRSTGNILNAANALIAHNPMRLCKSLWTRDGHGEPIRRYSAFNEVDEARFVVERVRRYSTDDGYRRDECAILYRTTAQSRLFEEALTQAKIPYRVYGGLRFFERAEVRDALGYLRLIANPDDDAAFERVVNTPSRGIGERTLDALREHARSSDKSLWRAADELLATGSLGPRAGAALERLLDLIRDLHAKSDGLAIRDLAAAVIEAAELKDFYRKAKDGKGDDRIENLEKLVETADRFQHELDEEDEDGSPLSSFLAHAALEAGEAQADGSENAVQLMTIHSAQGLEFPIVFLTGLEEDLFPHSMSAEDPSRLEEERRLCYVGMTRAMHQLFVTHAESRRLHGREDYPFPSRFLREIPSELVEEVRASGLTRPAAPATQVPGTSVLGMSSARSDTGYRAGQRIVHPKFGEGVVLNSEGSGAQARIQVNFESVGPKWLVLANQR
jgi:DNA helicase II / ATP-dependent DNA helicase PcrA